MYIGIKREMVFSLNRREDTKDGENEKAFRNNKDDRNETEFFRIK